MDYWEFCELGITSLSEEEMASCEETTASEEDIRFWKGLKIRLAVQHLNESLVDPSASATQAELDYLLNKRPKTKIPNFIYQRAQDREF